MAAPALTNPLPRKNFASAANAYGGLVATLAQGARRDRAAGQGSAAKVVGKFDYGAVQHKDLGKERVNVYVWGPGMQAWRPVDAFVTDRDGKIRVPLGVLPVGHYVVRMIVEGDLSSVDDYVSVVKPGRGTILFDVDGTLTQHDFEAYLDYAGIRTARPYLYAPEPVKAYLQKGYEVVFLTARPYWTTRDGREWLATYGLLGNHYHATDDGDTPIPRKAEAYKTSYISHLRNTVGLNIVRAYGNASTDIAAYRNAGLDPARTFINGPNAGKAATQAISGDYTAHYYQMAPPTPAAACWR